jgi:Protein of unknown function (DUF2384)
MPSLSEISIQDEAVAFHRRIDQVLAALSAKEREVLTRFYLREQSAERICREMDLSHTDFRLLKSRAKARFWRGRARGGQQGRDPRQDVDLSPKPKAVLNLDEMLQEAVDLTQVLPVIAHAIAVFGDEKKASHWLATPLPLLGDRSPTQTLEHPAGIKLVEQVLTRIEHNIPS